MEGQEYHIRRKSFNSLGYRIEFFSEEDSFMDFFEKTLKLVIVDDLDYNFLYEDVGMICISMEGGYIHLIFEDGRFSDFQTEQFMQDMKKKLQGKEIEVSDIEYYRSY